MSASEAQPIPAPPHPYEQQILANVGNRYVVFGSQIRMHGQALLGPSDVGTRFAERVGDETDFPLDRLIKSVQVKDAEVCYEPASGPLTSNLSIKYFNGSTTAVMASVDTLDFESSELE